MTITREISYSSQTASGRFVSVIPRKHWACQSPRVLQWLSIPGGTVYTSSHNGLILIALEDMKVTVKDVTLSLDLDKGVGVCWREKNKGVARRGNRVFKGRGAWRAWAMASFPPRKCRLQGKHCGVHVEREAEIGSERPGSRAKV